MSRNRDAGTGAFAATKAIVFMATPHQGSDMAAIGSLFSRIWTSMSGSKYTASADQLRRMSEALKTINADFVHTASSLQILTFYEQKPIRFASMVR